MAKLLSFSRATLKHQIASRKDDVKLLIDEVYNEHPHMFPVPATKDDHENDELKHIAWGFIKKNLGKTQDRPKEQQHLTSKKSQPSRDR